MFLQHNNSIQGSLICRPPNNGFILELFPLEGLSCEKHMTVKPLDYNNYFQWLSTEVMHYGTNLKEMLPCS